MPAQTASSASNARELREAVAAQRVEADGDAMEAGGSERVGLIGEQNAVGREREVGEAGLPGEHADQARQLAAQQRLAAGEADLVDAERRGTRRPARAISLEVEQILARQPGVVLLRHAVLAAEIAAIGDRQPQVPQRARAGVERHS